MPTQALSKRITIFLAAATALVVLTIAATTLWMADRHNHEAAQSSQTMVSGAMKTQVQDLATLNVDYAWWDELLVKFVEEDMDWLDLSVGAAATESFAVDHLLIVRPSGDVAHSWTMEGRTDVDSQTIPAGLVARMVDLVSGLPLLPVEARNHTIKIDGTIFLMSVVRITPQENVDTLQPAELPYLMMARDLSSARFAEIGSHFLIDDLTFSETRPEVGESIALRGLDEEILGYATWTPPRPGDQLLAQVMVPLILALALFVFVAVLVTRHIGKSIEIVEISLGRAQSADQAKSDFLANISHELRTPMNGVISIAHILKTKNLDEQQASLLDIILKSSDGLMELIDGLLDFSTLESGKLEFQEEVFSISEVVDSIETVHTERTATKGLSFHCSVSALVPDRVVGDSARFRQILTNLLSNAVKFTEKGAIELAVTGSQKGKKAQIVIEVSDTGIGIAKDMSTRIFERFWQIDTTRTRRADGSGLGLSIIKLTVDKLKGRIDVASELGKGSKFRVSFELPVHGSDQQAEIERTHIEQAA